MQNNILNKYLHYLGSHFGTTNFKKILILNIGIRLYPLLCSRGICFTEPIGLVADSSEQLKAIYNELAGFADIREAYASLDMKKNELETLYRSSEYELFYVDYYGGKRCDENLRYFRTLLNSQKSEHCISIVGFRGYPPEEITDFLAGILYIQPSALIHTTAEEQNLRHTFTLSLLKYIEKNQNSIFREIDRLVATDGYRQNDNNMGYRFFNAASAVFKLLLEDLNPQKLTLSIPLEDTIKQLSAEFEVLEIDNLEVEKQFLRMFFNAAKDICSIVDREKCPPTAFENVDELAMYDTKYYYLPQSMLRKIFEPWQETSSFVKIKNILKKQGLIVTQGGKRNYFTIKTIVISTFGESKEIHTVKIPREKLDLPGKLTWAEMINVKGESHEN